MSITLSKIVNLTPWILKAYGGHAHWYLSFVLYEEAFATKREAEETKSLILREHPEYYVEITRED